MAARWSWLHHFGLDVVSTWAGWHCATWKLAATVTRCRQWSRLGRRRDCRQRHAVAPDLCCELRNENVPGDHPVLHQRLQAEELLVQASNSGDVLANGLNQVAGAALQPPCSAAINPQDIQAAHCNGGSSSYEGQIIDHRLFIMHRLAYSNCRHRCYRWVFNGTSWSTSLVM